MLANDPGDSPSVLLAGLSALVQSWCPGLTTSMAQVNDGLGAVAVRVTESRSRRWFAILLSNDDIHGAASELDAGACAVITVHSPLEELRSAIATLEGGDAPFLATPLLHGLVHGLLHEEENHWPDGHVGKTDIPRLTKREREVLGLLCGGYTNREIAAELVVSVNTVRTHIHSLADKLGGSSRARIVINARAAGIPEAWGFGAPSAVA